ncbi:MAG TPA: AAA family ATPase [Algoriphagus sp.]|uniref:AAA family ATPase n=1 Tax=unclassified Algoriphagus TaxID=2641541 RepID=UPI000C4C53C6|nr:MULTISPECIES: ATP-binding protein [unclassified Algoriphagus]MAL15951.1 AAA family ATPase [Algoriphagus sp.]MAN89015.1 AAA family ATPase [Algoriphagus sp.]QYH40573.1 AAA family ATPase [Algoriphagus sp. NBT04N3]HAS59922.1 AAA family ATPase [Algoriphagus sp.]HCD89224.1 AAA family ATPase [Algoriphagus sp.]
MTQFDYIKDIARFGLENDQEKLKDSLQEMIEHARKSKKTNLAIQLQSILKEAIRHHSSGGSLKTSSGIRFEAPNSKGVDELILDQVTSDYRLSDLICAPQIKESLDHFILEHRKKNLLQALDLPIAHKILFYGPSGCGKTLASYVIAGELEKILLVVNLGAIVSSKLGETSKNLAKIFKMAASGDYILFLDEFDSLGKVRDYSQDHGEMKRVVNTILQLFDYLPQSTIVIAATNQVGMLDDALIRRFDTQIEFELPTDHEIEELIQLTLKRGVFTLDSKSGIKRLIQKAKGLSFYSIQKTLIAAMKRSLYKLETDLVPAKVEIDKAIWEKLIEEEKTAISNSGKV